MSSVIKKENVVLVKWPHWGIDENNRRFDKKCQYFMYPLSQMFCEKPFLPQAPYLCLLSDPKGNILWSVLSNYTYDPNIICVSHKWLYNFRGVQHSSLRPCIFFGWKFWSIGIWSDVTAGNVGGIWTRRLKLSIAIWSE